MAAMRGGLGLLVAVGCYTRQERPATAPNPTPVANALRVTTDRGAPRLTLDGADVRPDSVLGVLVDAANRRGDDWTADEAAVQGDRSTPRSFHAVVRVADARAVLGRS